MPTVESIHADIDQAVTPGFRARLIARGQARAMIWRDRVLPPGTPGFSPQLSYDLHSYGYSLLELGLWKRSCPKARAAKPIATSTSLWPRPPIISLISRREPIRC